MKKINRFLFNLIAFLMILFFSSSMQVMAKEVKKPEIDDELEVLYSRSRSKDTPKIIYRTTKINGKVVTTEIIDESTLKVTTSFDGAVTSEITITKRDYILLAKLISATGVRGYNASVSMAAIPINRVKYGYASSIEKAISQIADIEEVKAFKISNMYTTFYEAKMAIIGLDPEGDFLGEDSLYVVPSSEETTTISNKVDDGNYTFFSSEGYNQFLR